MEYVRTQEQFIGLRVFPIVEVMKKAATFPAITRESTTRLLDTKRAAGGNYNRDGFDTEDIPYNCEEHGLEGPLDDSQRNLYKTDFDAEFVTVQTIGDKLLLAQEGRISAAAFNTSVFTGSALYTDVSAAPWTAAGSDVIGHVKAAREKVRQNCGVEPNAIVMNKSNWDKLIENTAIKAAIQYVARLTEQELRNALADILGVQKVIVGKAIYNSAKQGKTFSGAEVWGSNYALIGYIPEDKDIVAPAVGRSPLWVEDSPENQTVESYREEGVRSDVYRVRQNIDEVVVDPYFGHLLKVR
jgi:hypothetical protein